MLARKVNNNITSRASSKIRYFEKSEKSFVHAPEAFTVRYKSFVHAPEEFTVEYNFVHVSNKKKLTSSLCKIQNETESIFK